MNLLFGTLVITSVIAVPIFAIARPTLFAEEVLQKTQYLQSGNQRYKLLLQSDGSLNMFRHDGTIRWAMGKNGEFAKMQGDGNFVQYTKYAVAVFNTGTYGNPGAKLHIQDDGNLVVYRADWGAALWNIGADASPLDPTKSGDVVGRELDVNGAESLGHVGLWDGDQVIQVMKGESKTVQLATLNQFKGAMPNGYWGKATFNIPWSFTKLRCYEPYCSVNWQYTYEENRRAIAKLAYQAYVLGADYTLTKEYTPPRYGSPYQSAQRGVFRCDTFVYYALEVSRQYRYTASPTAAEALWTSRLDQLRYQDTPRGMHNMLKTFQ